MKTDSVFCFLSKKCKEEYSEEVSEKILREEELKTYIKKKAKINSKQSKKFIIYRS